MKVIIFNIETIQPVQNSEEIAVIFESDNIPTEFMNDIHVLISLPDEN